MNIQTNEAVLTAIAEYSLKLHKEKSKMMFAGQEIIRRCHLIIEIPVGHSIGSWMHKMIDKHPEIEMHNFVSQATLEGFINKNRVVKGLYAKDAVLVLNDYPTSMLQSTSLLCALDNDQIHKRYSDKGFKYQTQATLWIITQPVDLPIGVRRRCTIIQLSKSDYMGDE